MTLLRKETRSIGIISEIVRSHLYSAAEEMRRTLIRTAFNPVIYDVLDFGISIYDREQNLIAEATGLPAFIGANDFAIRKAVDYVKIENFRPGDIFMMNYPYWNSAHSSDATLFAPVFDLKSDELVAFECIRAHWIDLGAKDPGYVIDSNSMHQEGIIFPGTRVYRDGKPDKEVLEILRFNSRAPDVLLGDLNAQIAAIRSGEKRIHHIFQKFGRDVIAEAVGHFLSHSEQETLAALRDLPHGTWTAEDYLDDDGISKDLIGIRATVTITDDKFVVDWTGSSPAVKGPVNMPLGATYSVSKIAFKAMTTPRLPSNAGNYRPLKVEAPEGSIMHATYPAATYTLWTSHIAFEVIFKALAQAMADKISACSGGDLPGFQMNGVHPITKRYYALSSGEPIGWGASHDHDGSSGLQEHTANRARNIPIEVLELRTGIMVRGMEFLQDSGGPGKFRGGLGIRRNVAIVADGELLSVIKKSRTRPWSLAGGWEPEPSCMIMFIGTDKEVRVGTYRTPVKKGDRCALIAAGGGGYGNPVDRDCYSVADDVLDGYVSIEAARDIYKVAIKDGHVDLEATDELRAKSKTVSNQK